MRLIESTVILRAISEKLIPGLPYTTKVAMLQQTSTIHRGPVRDDETLSIDLDDELSSGKSVLRQVFESDLARKETLREIAGKSKSEIRSTQKDCF